MAKFVRLTKNDKRRGFCKDYVYRIWFDEDDGKRYVTVGSRDYSVKQIINYGWAKYFERSDGCAVCGEVHPGSFIWDRKGRKLSFMCLADKLKEIIDEKV